MISCSRSQQQNTRLAQDWPGDAPIVFEQSQKALREQKFTFDMLDDLHLQRSEKGTPPGQQGEYTVVIVDTHLKYGMGSRKYKGCNRWKRARKGLLYKEQ